MNHLQRHRGPDGSATLIDGEIGFAHRRLAILDLSSSGGQPCRSEDRRYWLTYNGEIHNFLELRSELEKLGRTFRSRGDTEVVLQAFEEWGPQSFSRFNGMWGLAIWDSVLRKLYLSRDRFGIKPLHYSLRGARFTFASEIKAILSIFPKERQVDRRQLAIFLGGGSPPDGGESTFFSNVHSVLPAHYLTLDSSGAVTSHRYWDPDPCSDPIQSDQSVERLRELLTDSVRLRLRSDVPVALTVSGGLDSSSIARLAAEVDPRVFECFALRYPHHPTLDESRFSRMVMDDPDRFRVHWLEPENSGLVDRMSRIVWHHDAPCPIRGRLAWWTIHEEVGRMGKVLLIGEGGDELFAGYRRFVLPYLIDRVRDDGPGLLKDFSELSSAWRLLRSTNPNLWRMAMQFYAPLARRSSIRLPFGEPVVLTDEWMQHLEPFPPERFFNSWMRADAPRSRGSLLNSVLWEDFRQLGLPELLLSADRLGMAHSVECRPPFLDHRLVEFAFSLDYRHKMGDGQTKRILRQAMAGILPEPVRYRSDKKGMPTPYTEFFRDRTNFEELQDLLCSGRLIDTGILERTAIERLLSRLKRRYPPVSTPILTTLWRCATAELWYRQFIDQPASSTL